MGTIALERAFQIALRNYEGQKEVKQHFQNAERKELSIQNSTFSENSHQELR